MQFWSLLATGSWLLVQPTYAEPPVASDICQPELIEMESAEPEPRVTRGSGLPSLGGWQFWTDHLVLDGWRIQRNVVTHRFRLLDHRNRIRATSEHKRGCEQALGEVAGDYKALHQPVVITLHGLGRTRRCMGAIGEALQDCGMHWVNFEYASTREPIAAHACALHDVIDGLVQRQRIHEGPPLTIHFVGHSMGNIVVRHFIADELRRRGVDSLLSSQPDVGWHAGRTVMIAPPNQGSAMAALMKRTAAFRWIAGASGQQLSAGDNWDALEERLATPPSPFGIIAGGRGKEHGFSPILSGDDDLIVSVDETRLEDADDFPGRPRHAHLHHASGTRRHSDGDLPATWSLRQRVGRTLTRPTHPDAPDAP